MSSLRPSKRTRDDHGLVDPQSRPSKRSFTFPVAHVLKHRERRNSEGSILDSFGALHLYVSPIETLPQELLLQVFEHLVHPSLVTAGFPEQQAIHRRDGTPLRDDEPDIYDYVGAVKREDLRNVCLVSRKFNMAATTLLYRCAQLAITKSPKSFMLTLSAHPDLQPLVKHVSVPTYRGRIGKRFNFAFSHDTDNWTYSTEIWPPENEIHFAECREYFGGDLLRLMIPLVPNLRTLVIPQANLLDGPFTKDLVLRNLTTLRITLMIQNEQMFYIYGFSHAVRTTTWLTPDFIGQRFPALQRLEISTPNGRWEASLVSEEFDTAEGGSPLKYAESLKTTTMLPMIPADWDIMSLKRPIFHQSKLHTLELDGPSVGCHWAFEFGLGADWNLNRFCAEKGNGLRTLSLDWELHDDDDGDPGEPSLQEIYFGAEWRLITLDKLTNLAHLTVSLQVLFGYADMFWNWVEGMKTSPDTELAKLLPPSLRTLRIAEYIQGVSEEPWDSLDEEEEEEEDHDAIRYHSRRVYRFLQALRAWWLLCEEGRQLWFRRDIDLDLIALDTVAEKGRTRLTYILDDGAEKDGKFQRVLRPLEYTETTDGPAHGPAQGPAQGPTENKDKAPDGRPDQRSDGEKVGVYQDGKLVLV